MRFQVNATSTQGPRIVLPCENKGRPSSGPCQSEQQCQLHQINRALIVTGNKTLWGCSVIGNYSTTECVMWPNVMQSYCLQNWLFSACVKEEAAAFVSHIYITAQWKSFLGITQLVKGPLKQRGLRTLLKGPTVATRQCWDLNLCLSEQQSNNLTTTTTAHDSDVKVY